MGAFYRKEWKCSKCDYSEIMIKTRRVIEPQKGVYKAEIEYRWCNNCNGVRSIFTGKGGKYFPGTEPNSKESFYKGEIKGYEEELPKLIDDYKNLLEQKKKNFFSFLTKINKKIADKAMYIKYNKDKIKLFYESKVICDKLTLQSDNFYKSKKLKAKCLCCESTNVSNFIWDYDLHQLKTNGDTCGGEILNIDLGRGAVGGSNEVYEHVTYTHEGNTNSEMIREIFNLNLEAGVAVTAANVIDYVVVKTNDKPYFF